MPQMPPLSGWVAPTISVEELEKRISELKAVQFWLDQNSRALTATVQALEVQKMTLSTLQGMNVAMGDIAKAFTPQAAPPRPGRRRRVPILSRGRRAPGLQRRHLLRSRPRRRRRQRAATPPATPAPSRPSPRRAWWTRCNGGPRSRASSSRSPPMR